MIINTSTIPKGRFIEVIVSKPLVKEGAAEKSVLEKEGQTHLNYLRHSSS